MMIVQGGIQGMRRIFGDTSDVKSCEQRPKLLTELNHNLEGKRISFISDGNQSPLVKNITKRNNRN